VWNPPSQLAYTWRVNPTNPAPTWSSTSSPPTVERACV
jgi:hypothetical protein